MARFLLLWHINLASWPMNDPKKNMELNERLWAVIENLMKKGVVKDYGIFPDGESGFAIGEGETAEVYRDVNMFLPYVSTKVQEIISLEKQKETIRALHAQMAAMTK